MLSHDNSSLGRRDSCSGQSFYRGMPGTLKHLARSVAEFKDFPPAWIYHQTFHMLYNCSGQSLCSHCKAIVVQPAWTCLRSCREVWGAVMARASPVRVQGCGCRRGGGRFWRVRQLPWVETCQSQADFTPERRFGFIWPAETGSLFIFFQVASLQLIFSSALRDRRLATSRSSVSPAPPFAIFLITRGKKLL